MAIDERTAAGVILFVGTLIYYFWAMQRQLRRLRQGYYPGTRYGHLAGFGALIYNLLETAIIAMSCFFTLHIAYVLTQHYSLIQLRYGLIGIVIGLIILVVARLFLLLLRVGSSRCSRLLAASWVSVLSGTLAFGVWTIFTTQGKVLEMRIPETSFSLVLTALVPAVTVITWMTISYVQSE